MELIGNRPQAVARLGFVVLAALVAGLCWPMPVHAQDAKTAASISGLSALPGDTTLVLQFRSCADLTKKLKASPFYGLRNHPDIKKFIDDLNKSMERELTDARAKLGFDPIDLISLADGEVLFAIGGLEKIITSLGAKASGGDVDISPNDVPVLLLVNAGANAPQFREKLSKIYDLAQKEGSKKEVEDFRGGKITTLSAPAPKDKDKDKVKDKDKPRNDLEKLFIGDMGSVIMACLSRPFLDQVMANLTAPGADALVKSADFQATLREVRTDADATFFLNIRPLAVAARKALQGNPMVNMIWQLVEGKILGRSLKNLAISMTLREGDVQQIVFVNNGGASDGILGIVRGQPFAARPHSIFPEDSDQVSTTAINFPAFYSIVKDVGQMVMSATQGFAGPPGGQPGAPGQPDPEQMIEAMYGIKMKPVVEAVGNNIHFFQRGGASEQNQLGSFVFALELKDEMPIKDLLSKASLMMGLTGEKYLDRDIYPLSAPSTGPPAAVSPTLGIADKMLVFGINQELVKEVIRRSGKESKGIGGTPGYQAVAGLLPTQVTVLSYSSAKAFRDSLKMVKDALRHVGDQVPVPDLTPISDIVTGSIGWGLWKPNGLYAETIVALKK